MRHFLNLFILFLYSIFSTYAQTVTIPLPITCGTPVNMTATPAEQKVSAVGVIACIGSSVTFGFGSSVLSATVTYNGNTYTGNPIVIPVYARPLGVPLETGWIFLNSMTYIDGTVCNYSPSIFITSYHVSPSLSSIDLFESTPFETIQVNINPAYSGNANYRVTFTSPTGISDTYTIGQFFRLKDINGQYGTWTVQVCDNYNTCEPECLTQTIYMPPPPCTTPSCSASGPSSGNIGTTYTFTAGTVTPAGSSVTWTASGGGSPASGTGSTANVSWATTGAKTVTFTVTNASSPSGCSPSATSTCSANINISNNPCTTPLCSASGPSSGNTGTSYTFTAGTVTPVGSSVTWTASGGGSPASGTGSTANVSWATTGVKSVTFTVTNASSPSGCSPSSTSTCSANINISAPCTPIICDGATGPTTGNTNTVYTFTGQGINNGNVTWTASGGGSPASGTGTTANVSWATSGTKTVSFTFTNNSSPAGCSPESTAICSTNINISVGCDPINSCTAFSSSGPTGIAGTTYNFGAFFINPPVGTTYAWTATGGAIPSSGTGLSANISWATNGIKIITFTATNSSTPAGCSPTSTASCQVQFEVTGSTCIYGDCDITGLDKIAVADPRQAYTYTVSITPNASLPSSDYEWELYEVGSIPFTPIQTGTGTIADVYFPYDGNFVIQFKVDHSSDGISCDPSEPYICEKYISVGSACDVPTCNFIASPDPLTAANGSTNTNYTFTIAGNVVSWEATGGGVPATGTGNTASVQWSSTGSKKVRFTLDNGDMPSGCRPNSINVCDFKMILRTSSTLPVELISFTGESKNCESKLTWKTGSEVNFDHFEIQKSDDNENFTKLEEIKAKGSNSTYTFFENTRKKQVHYRLLMVDYDGNTKESNIITLNSTCERDGIYISPNPTKNIVNVSFEYPSVIGKTIKLTSVEGKIIKEIVIDQLNEIIDLSGNNSGIYMINIPGYNSFKIVKN